MSPAVALQVTASVPVSNDAAFACLELVMVVGIALALIASYLTARANKRLGERIRRTRQQKREEADAAAANVDALAGRPPLPAWDDAGARDVND